MVFLACTSKSVANKSDEATSTVKTLIASSFNTLNSSATSILGACTINGFGKFVSGIRATSNCNPKV